ncbi:MAG: extracellular solute-binding protein, partial [Epulopiscium sp.]|nr:extracellular solute-binding protein [Candidatus Epulonipiscium sp.]
EKVILEDFKEYDIETMVLPLPNFEGTIPHAVQQGAGMVVVKSDKNREYASVEFLKWFTDKERNIKFSIESGYLPVKKESSSIDAIGEYLNKNNEHDITKQLRTLLPVATKQVSSYELYTNKAFKKGTDARMILTRSLIEKSKSDRDKIVNLIENGYSKDEAFKEFITEDNFKQWLTKFKGDLEKIIN